MGIRGLTTYIAQYSDIFFQDYDLHGSFLVIDGNSICFKLYQQIAKNDLCFGGNYDKFAYCVSNFFDKLAKCEVISLIIFDGGSENKKLSTLLKRTSDRIRSASQALPYQENPTEVYPLFIKEVFKNVVTQKGIRCTQSLFEADDEIASVARILKYPVLTNDSDFYVFDVTYIPFDRLDIDLIENPCGSGYIQKCKVYKLDHLSRRFPGMDKTAVPLVAILLGNDYVDRSVFKDFFRTLRLPRELKRRYKKNHQIIEAIFRWLQNHDLDSGIAKILSTLRLNPIQRAKVLEVMEMIINGYLGLSTKMLSPLGYSQFSLKFNNLVIQTESCPAYKFTQNLNDLRVIEEPKYDDETDFSCNEDSSYYNNELDNIIELENESDLSKIVPSLFFR